LQETQFKRQARRAQICAIGRLTPPAATGSSRRPSTAPRVRWLAATSALLLLACASTPRGATAANLAKAQQVVPNGFELFEQNCAGCHGKRGESLGRAPRVMGAGALPEYPPERNLNADPAAGDPELLRLRAQTRPAGAPWRDPFRSAQDLYRYVSTSMPLPADKVGSLSAEQYWAIVNFMLLAHGAQVPPEGVTQANAHSVRL
jgi:mono/diheme cytochrome c family protein